MKFRTRVCVLTRLFSRIVCHLFTITGLYQTSVLVLFIMHTVVDCTNFVH